MTSQVLIQAMSENIASVFEGWKIYEGETNQEFTEPYFLIEEIESSLQLVMGNRYKSSHSFDIHCVPRAGSTEKMHQAAHVLFEILEYLDTHEGMLRGTGFKTKVKEGITHVYVNYEFFIVRPAKREEPMNELNSRISKKG